MLIQRAAITNSDVNINKTAKTALDQPEQINKPDENIENGEKKMYAALSGLAVLSLAGIAVALNLKKGKPVSQSALGSVKIISDGSEIAKTAKTVKKAAKNSGKSIKKVAGKIAKDAAENVSGGKNYAGIKKDATKNLDRNGKKIVKDALAKARAERLKQDLLMRQTALDGNKKVSSSIGDIKNAGQGIKSARNANEVQERIKIARDAADSAKKQADTVKGVADNIPTRKNIKRAKVADNRAIQAKLSADRVQASGEKRAAEIINDALKKEENIRKTIENTNPERLLEGQAKMEANALKTTERAVQRKAARTMNTPGYKRALNKFHGYSKEKLFGVINSKKASNVEKTVAKDLLESLI